MRLLASFLRSLLEKGLKITLQKIFSVIEDIYFDKKYGIDTSKIVEVEELGIYDESTRHSSPYQPTRVRHFHQLMKTLEFPIASVFVDFGSGKGRILLLASEYKFKRVVGVEISSQLCEIARRNVVLYETRSERPLNIEVVESDVLDYNIRDDDNVFFLHNPFDRYIMEKIIQKVKASLEISPRDVWIIFNNFMQKNLLDEDNRFTKLKEVEYGEAEFVVYTTN